MAAGTALNVSLFSALSDKRGMSRNCWQKYTKYTKRNNTRDTFFHHPKIRKLSQWQSQWQKRA